MTPPTQPANPIPPQPQNPPLRNPPIQPMLSNPKKDTTKSTFTIIHAPRSVNVMGQKIATILSIILLILAIATGVLLTRQSQDIREKAVEVTITPYPTGTSVTPRPAKPEEGEFSPSAIGGILRQYPILIVLATAAAILLLIIIIF